MGKRIKKVGVYIGRFQPFHDGHLQVVKKALAENDMLVICVGSTDKPRSTKNPWTFEERVVMIGSSLTARQRKRVAVRRLVDMPGEDEAWVRQVKMTAWLGAKNKFMVAAGSQHDFKYTLMGCNKGADTYYLKLFKDWKKSLVPSASALHATDIRRQYFSGEGDFSENISNGTFALMHAFKLYNPVAFEALKELQENSK